MIGADAVMTSLKLLETGKRVGIAQRYTHLTSKTGIDDRGVVLLVRLWVPDADGFATFWIAVGVSAVAHHAWRQCGDELIGAMESTA